MDPIAEMLNTIKNAQQVAKDQVVLPFSNLRYELAHLLQKNGFLEKVEKKGRAARKTLEISLKYQGKEPRISGVKKISRPSQRFYLPCSRIKPVKGGLGLAIVSTPQGLMTDKEARKKGLGGELICEIW